MTSMDTLPAHIWIAVLAHPLQRQWRAIEPVLWEELAWDLWRDEGLRAQSPDEAAQICLEPITAR
jgi:hypothetical protein